MLVVNKRCKICKLCKEDKRFLNRLYQSRYYVPHSRDKLSDIHRDYKDFFSIAALKNHARKHQFIDSSAYNAAMLKKADKDAEQKALTQIIDATSAIQEVINVGAQRLDDGEITVSTSELLRASQIKIAADAKAKDQELQMIEMIAHFASGSNTNERVYVESDTA